MRFPVPFSVSAVVFPFSSVVISWERRDLYYRLRTYAVAPRMEEGSNELDTSACPADSDLDRSLRNIVEGGAAEHLGDSVRSSRRPHNETVQFRARIRRLAILPSRRGSSQGPHSPNGGRPSGSLRLLGCLHERQAGRKSWQGFARLQAPVHAGRPRRPEIRPRAHH